MVLDDRLPVAAEGVEHQRQVAMRDRVARVDRDLGAQLGLGGLELALGHVDDAQVVVGDGLTRIRGQRELVFAAGGFEVAAQVQGDAQVAVGQRRARRRAHGLLEEREPIAKAGAVAQRHRREGAQHQAGQAGDDDRCRAGRRAPGRRELAHEEHEGDRGEVEAALQNQQVRRRQAGGDEDDEQAERKQRAPPVDAGEPQRRDGEQQRHETRPERRVLGGGQHGQRIGEEQLAEADGEQAGVRGDVRERKAAGAEPLGGGGVDDRGARDQIDGQRGEPTGEQPRAQQRAPWARRPFAEPQLGDPDDGQHDRGLLAGQRGEEEDRVGEPAAPAPRFVRPPQGQPGAQGRHPQQDVVAPRDPGHGLGERRVDREQQPAQQGDAVAQAQPAQQKKQQPRRQGVQGDVGDVIAAGAPAPERVDRERGAGERPVVGVVPAGFSRARRKVGLSERAPDGSGSGERPLLVDDQDVVVLIGEVEPAGARVERRRHDDDADEAEPPAQDGKRLPPAPAARNRTAQSAARGASALGLRQPEACGLRSEALPLPLLLHFRVSSRSSVIFAVSPTITPPASRAWFQVRPKSLRLIVVVAVAPRFTFP